MAIQPKLAGTNTARSLSGPERQELQAGVEQLRASGVALSVRVLRADGRPIFVPPAYRSPMPDSSAGLRSAAAGTATERIVRPPLLTPDGRYQSYREATGRTDRSGMRIGDSRRITPLSIAQVYVPVRPGPAATVVAVAIIDVDYRPAMAQMRAGLQRMYAALTVGLLVLYVALAAISA